MDECHVATASNRNYAIAIHPVHATLLVAAVPLFLGGLLSDLAYSSNYQIQWSNFAAWLLAGAMVFTGFAFLWSVIDLVRTRSRGTGRILYTLALAAVFVVGLIDSFVHARDAWAVMPAGLALSVIVTLLAVGATWLGLAVRDEETPR